MCGTTEVPVSYTHLMKKQPIQFLLYDAEGKLIYNDLKERAFDQDQLGR